MQVVSVLMLALQGATVALCIHALIYCLHAGKRFATKANIAKIILSVTLGVKVVGFVTFAMPLFGACYGVAKAADLLYHLSMVAANTVLLSRATTIWGNARPFVIIECVFLVLRLAVGLWDVGATYAFPITDSTNPSALGTCFYLENFAAGITYISTDLVTDLYVTTSISVRLINHHMHLRRAGVGGNSLYSAIISSNLLRTILLLIINIISIILVTMPQLPEGSILLWSFANIAYVVTIVYDSDMVRFCQQLQAELSSDRPRPLRNRVENSGNYTGASSEDSCTPLKGGEKKWATVSDVLDKV
ncbi:uncharacterized protein VTP21DRAFT_8523 [Calcarisporiella thermophila]|uniref:uncharacterized protein n=1 Tax=Calcarisporiella thermophila TaxID=911321 RepID=UPI003741EFDA